MNIRDLDRELDDQRVDTPDTRVVVSGGGATRPDVYHHEGCGIATEPKTRLKRQHAEVHGLKPAGCCEHRLEDTR